jgi:hypothetical protein
MLGFGAASSNHPVVELAGDPLRVRFSKYGLQLWASQVTDAGKLDLRGSVLSASAGLRLLAGRLQ